MENKRIVSLNKFKMTYHGNFNDGFILKRKLDIRECKHILRDLLGIVLQDHEEFCDKEEYDIFNRDLVDNVNQWLEGNVDDDSLMEEYASDCGEYPIGIWNAFKIAEYLQHKNII